MPSQISIVYADQFTPLWNTANEIDIFAWATLGGDIVYGDPDNPLAVVVRAVDMVTDMFTAITSVLETLTGDVADPYVPLGPFTPASPTFGTGMEPFGNTLKTRAFVAVACQANYTWGLLNIPARFDPSIPFKWNFKFAASVNGSANQSPAYNLVKAYTVANGAPPILMVMELDAS